VKARPATASFGLRLGSTLDVDVGKEVVEVVERVTEPTEVEVAVFLAG
jgi:hypothetical protein